MLPFFNVKCTTKCCGGCGGRNPGIFHLQSQACEPRAASCRVLSRVDNLPHWLSVSHSGAAAFPPPQFGARLLLCNQQATSAAVQADC